MSRNQTRCCVQRSAPRQWLSDELLLACRVLRTRSGPRLNPHIWQNRRLRQDYLGGARGGGQVSATPGCYCGCPRGHDRSDPWHVLQRVGFSRVWSSAAPPNHLPAEDGIHSLCDCSAVSRAPEVAREDTAWYRKVWGSSGRVSRPVGARRCEFTSWLPLWSSSQLLMGGWVCMGRCWRAEMGGMSTGADPATVRALQRGPCGLLMHETVRSSPLFGLSQGWSECMGWSGP
jgi:hypothetical protein